MGGPKWVPDGDLFDPTAPTLLGISHVPPEQHTKRLQAFFACFTEHFRILELGDSTWDLSAMSLHELAERLHAGMNMPERFEGCIDRDVYVEARQIIAEVTGQPEHTFSVFGPLAQEIPKAKHDAAWTALQRRFPVLASTPPDFPNGPYAIGAAMSVVAIIAVMVPLARAMDRYFPGKPPWPVVGIASITIPFVFFVLLVGCLLALIRFCRFALPARLPAQCPNLGAVVHKIRRRIAVSGTDVSGPGPWTAAEIERELVALVATQTKRPPEVVDPSRPVLELLGG